MLQLAELRSITDRFSESRWMDEEMFILMAVHILKVSQKERRWMKLNKRIFHEEKKKEKNSQ